MSERLAPIPKIGERVFLQGAGKWGQVVPWPTDAVKEVLDLRLTHLRIQPINGQGHPIGELQYWPLSQASLSNKPGATALRPFVSRVEQRAQDKANKAKRPPISEDDDVAPDKPLQEDPLERED